MLFSFFDLNDKTIVELGAGCGNRSVYGHVTSLGLAGISLASEYSNCNVILTGFDSCSGCIPTNAVLDFDAKVLDQLQKNADANDFPKNGTNIQVVYLDWALSPKDGFNNVDIVLASGSRLHLNIFSVYVYAKRNL